MAASWRLPLDRAVRYAVSDALASLKSHENDLENTQRRSSQEVTTWNNYLAELRALHQLLLNLPSLEKAQWLTDDQSINAPTFTPFVHSINDARTNVRRVHNWLLSLSESTTDSTLELSNDSDVMGQTHYTHQVNQALIQLQTLPSPGSKAWQIRYQPSETSSPSRTTQQPLAAVA